MEKSILFYLLHSSIASNPMQIYKNLIMCYTRKILRFSSIASSAEYMVERNHDNAKEDEESALNCKHEVHDLPEVNYNDINFVTATLGLEAGRREARISRNDKQLELSEAVYELLEDKNASLSELKEAFYVFDRDEDGFITAFELWSVLRRLGFAEGMKYEECEKMIGVFDQDGDEKINFQEFKKMMENSM